MGHVTVATSIFYPVCGTSFGLPTHYDIRTLTWGGTLVPSPNQSTGETERKQRLNTNLKIVPSKA